MRHRLAYAQAKNPKANIVIADIMTKVSVGHNLKVTSDRPTFMTIDTVKGTFHEQKGKLTNTELDKFIRQVESGHLNIVRKLGLIGGLWNTFTDMIIIHNEANSAVIVG